MKLNLGTKVGVMLSSLVLGLVCFVGCNSEETPAPSTPATTGPGAKAPDAKPPVSPTKPDDKK